MLDSMFYIHQTSCISPLKIMGAANLDTIPDSYFNCLKAIEPAYEAIPPGILRRMGKAVRMGTGAAMPLLKNMGVPNGIIIGTANSGQEDCVKFLNQLIQYQEGMLTPANFVQSAPNAIAAQIGLLTNNHGYNVTHVHDGLAFELAAIDAGMLLAEYPLHNYLLGAVDDISDYNYTFEDKSGWYKTSIVSNKELYNNNSPGSIAGEGAAMFFINRNAAGAAAKLAAVDVLHDADENNLKKALQRFIKKYLPTGEKIDLLLTGENGDNRLNKYYLACESLLGDDCTVARFKHLCGEYPTAGAMGCWLACALLQQQQLPGHMVKKKGQDAGYKNILLYNNYKLMQHAFMLVSTPQ
jgi:hypothetical protein